MKLADVIAALESAYPPKTAEKWDAVGLVCGDPAEEVTRVLVCVDPTSSTVDEAVERGAQLLLAHHPLLLRGVNGVPADDPKGALVHKLIRNRAALYCAHTNADSALPGVSDALARAIGLTITGPLDAASRAPMDVLTVFVPVTNAEQVLKALTDAGAAAIGEQEDSRLEVVLPRARRSAVLAALRAVHPHEDFTVQELADLPGDTGLGRIGELPEAEPLRVFAQRVADALPATVQGVRAAGDPERLIKRVAVCGGAGDSFLSTVQRAGVDAYVTADLRHHPASEHIESGGPALVDVAHWASEWPWCEQAAEILREAFGGRVQVLVSTRRTDPWTVGATRTAAGGHA
ncbi:dinuclear metal center YbgI/SA1388 family protein [Lentzea atacamensis]|uniref:GTP cyclohydrolase 1 type 2 homolog n=1 Tax=Lentzea atacamensis TaxID=531938 RepID=A0A316IFM7_9PSEU|nr:Nif3-like dinuclear metal center hexameric protein [Lentzea atacamensis]PWK91793.1 dinuclear metal center YbgI/SA1388 family protein [Lentzea atacamensis]RAS63646.1 dinuclear metal center YbgI/SA1388 family protein [Lentzea atacamensis]